MIEKRGRATLVEGREYDFVIRQRKPDTMWNWSGTLERRLVDWDAFHTRCEAFKFDKFLPLIDALADVVEGKRKYQELQPSYQGVCDGIFKTPVAKSPRSWFGRRVELFFSILRNGKKYQQFGYTSMPSFLFNSVWAQFFDKEVKL